MSWNTKKGAYSSIYTCWNATTVVEELYTGQNCDGDIASAMVVYNASQTAFTFDCYNDELCETSVVREWLDASCENTGNFDEFAVVVDHCSYNTATQQSRVFRSTSTALEEYMYNSSDCSGDFHSRDILYQNGDCDTDTNGYYEISQCGDYTLGQSAANPTRLSVFAVLLIVFASHL